MHAALVPKTWGTSGSSIQRPTGGGCKNEDASDSDTNGREIRNHDRGIQRRCGPGRSSARESGSYRRWQGSRIEEIDNGTRTEDLDRELSRDCDANDFHARRPSTAKRGKGEGKQFGRKGGRKGKGNRTGSGEKGN